MSIKKKYFQMSKAQTHFSVWSDATRDGAGNDLRGYQMISSRLHTDVVARTPFNVPSREPGPRVRGPFGAK